MADTSYRMFGQAAVRESWCELVLYVVYCIKYDIAITNRHVAIEFGELHGPHRACFRPNGFGRLEGQCTAKPRRYVPA